MTKSKSPVYGAILLFIFLLVFPFIFSMFQVGLFTKFMCFALVALSLDLLWGYTGILSLGQGVYFGLGAYCMAMYLKLAASGSNLPDFMRSPGSGIRQLPFIWVPFKNPIIAIALVIIVPVVISILIGALTFINRIRGVYFSILSEALAVVFSVLLVGSQSLTGGSNGLTNFSNFMGASLYTGKSRLILFYVTLLILALVYFLAYQLIHHKIGNVLIAIRDSENRLRFTGYNTAAYKIFIYGLSAAISGVAGALYVLQVGIITPSDVGVMFSIEMVIWVAIGGKATLLGPVIGALVVNEFKTVISNYFPSLWSYFIGALFIIVILLFPQGFMGLKALPHYLANRKVAQQMRQRQTNPNLNQEVPNHVVKTSKEDS
ncbi:MAG: urea ABC transporter permease subunit UrtC [Lactobacillus sp.]|nr:urea ABC transporter permease subunit UrtC [Lactobacillus sp.]